MYDLYSEMPAGKFVVAAGNCVGSADFDGLQDFPVVRMDLQLASWGAFGWRKGSSYLAAYRRLRGMVEEYQVESVHAACCLPEGFLAWMLGRRLGIPYLLYVHGEELNIVRSSRELTWMTRRVFREAASIVANSRNTANLLGRDWDVPSARVRMLHPGVDTTRFRPAARDLGVRDRLGWADRPVVLTVGRLQPRKGHAQLIQALAEVRRVVPGVLYAIVGNGEERDSLHRLVQKLKLHEHVIMHGDLDGEFLLAAYQQCDLFALPNVEVNGDTEGFGIVLLEAQSCGRPVVAGDSGGTAETLRDGQTGVVLNCRDIPKLAKTLQSLLEESLRRERMGAAARQWVEDEFDWKKLRPAALRVFDEAFATAQRRNFCRPNSSVVGASVTGVHRAR